MIAAHVICSLCAAVAGLYLASRLRSGAPWIGRDGVYDLESIAVVVIGGTVLAGGRGGIWGTMAGVMIFSLIELDLQPRRRRCLRQAGAARHHHRRRRCRSTPCARRGSWHERAPTTPPAAACALAEDQSGLFRAGGADRGHRDLNPALSRAARLHELPQAAPRRSRSSRRARSIVIVSGGFDLSVGSIITCTVIGSSMLLDGDPDGTWWVIPLMYGIGLAVGLINGAVVCYLKVPSMIATLGMMITAERRGVDVVGRSPRGYLPEASAISAAAISGRSSAASGSCRSRLSCWSSLAGSYGG